MTTRSKQVDIDPDVLVTMTQHVESCFKKAELFFGSKFRLASCNFKQKGRAAGTAHLQKNEIRFNYFMYLQNPEVFINTVIPHEVAHIIVFQIYGDTVKPHGKEWQAVMLKVYGVKPDRTHTFDVPPPKEAYEYRCECQKHHFTKRRHSRVLKGAQYTCKSCKAILQFIAVV